MFIFIFPSHFPQNFPPNSSQTRSVVPLILLKIVQTLNPSSIKELLNYPKNKFYTLGYCSLLPEHQRKTFFHVVDWYCMCKKSGESIDHLLHCEVAKELLSLLF